MNTITRLYFSDVVALVDFLQYRPLNHFFLLSTFSFLQSLDLGSRAVTLACSFLTAAAGRRSVTPASVSTDTFAAPRSDDCHFTEIMWDNDDLPPVNLSVSE